MRKWMSVPATWASVAFVVLSSCSKPEPPPMAYAGPTVSEADLGLLRPVEMPPDGYTLLGEQPSKGLFPTALAVVRLDKPDPLFRVGQPFYISDHGWQVATFRTEEAVGWNGLFPTVREVREVVVMDARSVVAPDVTPPEVVGSAEYLQAGLLLIYGPREGPAQGAALAGMIYEVETRKPLAFVQAQASIEDYEVPRPDSPKHDLRHVDADYLAARKFERQVWACVRELIAKDQPPTATQPSPWKQAILEPKIIAPEGDGPVYVIPNRSGW